MKYRLYIDEVGTEGITQNSINHPNEKYLSLTGIIIENSEYKNICKKVYDFKINNILDYPDDCKPSAKVLHRKDILKRKKGYEFLKDEIFREAFDNNLLNIIDESEYVVITTVIDKKQHLETYKNNAYNPYYYCLLTIIERYFLFLREVKGRGDIMIEGRNSKNDKKIKIAFEKIYDENIKFHQRITSKTIKIKTKEKDVVGLQIADIIAFPSYRKIREWRDEKGFNLNDLNYDNFNSSYEKIDINTKIFLILLNKKFRISNSGLINGYGIKWLP